MQSTCQREGLGASTSTESSLKTPSVWQSTATIRHDNYHQQLPVDDSITRSTDDGTNSGASTLNTNLDWTSISVSSSTYAMSTGASLILAPSASQRNSIHLLQSVEIDSNESDCLPKYSAT